MPEGPCDQYTSGSWGKTVSTMATWLELGRHDLTSVFWLIETKSKIGPWIIQFHSSYRCIIVMYEGTERVYYLSL